MRGLLADANVEKHFRFIVQILEANCRREFWTALKLSALTFADLALVPATDDRTLWHRCQSEGLILLTANRNHDGPNSLEEAIRTLNQTHSLPVFTLAEPDRVLDDSRYREEVADQCLEYLVDVEKLRGTGRLYLP